MTLEDARIVEGYYVRLPTVDDKSLAVCQILLAAATLRSVLPVPLYYHTFEYLFKLGQAKARGARFYPYHTQD